MSVTVTWWLDEIYHGLTYGMDAPSVLEVDDSAFVLIAFPVFRR